MLRDLAAGIYHGRNDHMVTGREHPAKLRPLAQHAFSLRTPNNALANVTVRLVVGLGAQHNNVTGDQRLAWRKRFDRQRWRRIVQRINENDEGRFARLSQTIDRPGRNPMLPRAEGVAEPSSGG